LEDTVDTNNLVRGPMLIVSADSDHTAPWAMANAAYKKQKSNNGVTEIVKMPGRGHDDRRWLAGGRRKGARLRKAVRVIDYTRTAPRTSAMHTRGG
jgi:hypothetical protein